MRSRDFLAILALVACVALVLSRGYVPDSLKSREGSSEESLSEHLAREKLPLTSARVIARLEHRPEHLKDLVIEIECRGDEGFEVGFEDGEPVAYLMMNREDECPAIAGFVRKSDESESSEANEMPGRYSPPELGWLRDHRFALTTDSFVPFDGSESLLGKLDPAEVVEIYVYVWIDGGWRTCRLLLDPFGSGSLLESHAESEPPHAQFILDEFWRRCRE